MKAGSNSRPSMRYARAAESALQTRQRNCGQIDVPAGQADVKVTEEGVVGEKLRRDFARFAGKQRNIVVAPRDGKQLGAAVFADDAGVQLKCEPIARIAQRYANERAFSVFVDRRGDLDLARARQAVQQCEILITFDWREGVAVRVRRAIDVLFRREP